MRTWFGKNNFAKRIHPPSGPIRVGIVSGHVFDQSVWTAIVRGWLHHIDRTEFSLHIFYTGTTSDRETAIARNRATTFVQSAGDLRDWVDALLDQPLDVLIYPEIGMDSMSVKLASLRLVPLQVAAWGHPETTGLPTIDYYLSAEAFEPPEAQTYYRERLIALPGLGCAYADLA